jgi:hypothetical protein
MGEAMGAEERARERERFERWARDVALDLLGSGEITYAEALEDLTSEDGLAPDPARGRPAFYADSHDRAAAIEDLMHALYRHAFAPLVEGPRGSRTRAFVNVIVNADPSEDEADVAGVLMPEDRSGEDRPSLVFHAFRAWLKNYTATTEEDLLDLYRLVLSAAVPPYDDLITVASAERPLPEAEGDAA